ncbi:sigma-70 family RNA polymerase sigma factor [Streptomyces chumphonensis]|uniref:RNA polymerase sigma factor n=1 Tax=Streptomyces chumphonensis TaxID=1214925 RepID=UPI002964541A|nr:sigma-70 family RNA polymerase sigma factor [Streptomyces chumphonensis]
MAEPEPEKEDDALLVVRCQLGERQAFTGLVRAWHGPLWRYLRATTGGDGVADDLAQETWIGVLRGLPKLREPERFAPWLFTIARRALADHLRRGRAAPFGSVDLADAPGAPVDPGDFPGDVLDRLEVHAGLADLPPAEREVLVLFHLADLPTAGCADVLGVPAGTVKSRLFRARRMLRDILTERGHDR